MSKCQSNLPSIKVLVALCGSPDAPTEALTEPSTLTELSTLAPPESAPPELAPPELALLAPTELVPALQLVPAAPVPPLWLAMTMPELAYATAAATALSAMAAAPASMVAPAAPLVYVSPWALLGLGGTSLLLLTPPRPPYNPATEGSDLIYCLRNMVLKSKQFCDVFLRKFHNILQGLLERHGDNDVALAEAMNYFYQLFTVDEVDDGMALLAVLQLALVSFKLSCVAPNQRPDDANNNTNGARRGPAFNVAKSSAECQHCGSRNTPEWRRGPEGPRLVCNACGLFYSKLIRKYGRVEATLMMRTRKLNGQDQDRRVY